MIGYLLIPDVSTDGTCTHYFLRLGVRLYISSFIRRASSHTTELRADYSAAIASRALNIRHDAQITCQISGSERLQYATPIMVCIYIDPIWQGQTLTCAPRGSPYTVLLDSSLTSPASRDAGDVLGTCWGRAGDVPPRGDTSSLTRACARPLSGASAITAHHRERRWAAHRGWIPTVSSSASDSSVQIRWWGRPHLQLSA